MKKPGDTEQVKLILNQKLAAELKQKKAVNQLTQLGLQPINRKYKKSPAMPLSPPHEKGKTLSHCIEPTKVSTS